MKFSHLKLQSDICAYVFQAIRPPFGFFKTDLKELEFRSRSSYSIWKWPLTDTPWGFKATCTILPNLNYISQITIIGYFKIIIEQVL